MPLVLSVKPQDSICIGDDIVVTNMSAHRVKLAVVAPRKIPVDRDRVRERKEIEGVRDSSDTAPNPPEPDADARVRP